MCPKNLRISRGSVYGVIVTFVSLHGSYWKIKVCQAPGLLHVAYTIVGMSQIQQHNPGVMQLKTCKASFIRYIVGVLGSSV